MEVAVDVVEVEWCVINNDINIGVLHQSYHRDRGGRAREMARGRGCEGKERRYQGKCAA